MKIFGSVYPFVESGDVNLRLGRHVANYEFLKALLRSGGFDEYHLFCLSAAHARTTMERIRREDIPDAQKRKVRVSLIHYLVENLKSTRYHVFHLGGWGYFFPGLVYLRNKYARHRFPITGLIHSLNGIETPFHGLKICAAPLLPFDTIVCSSEAGRGVLRASFARLCDGLARTGARIAFRGRTEVIPLGVDDAFPGPVERAHCRGLVGLPTQASVLLSVGRLSPGTKGDPFPLLQCFRMLVDRNPGRELVLLLAGGASGPEQALVARMVEELGLGASVKLTANFGSSLKRMLYGAADVFVSLSDNLQETFGISVIEAMAAGVPVVASDLNGYKELFQHRVEGYKVPTTWLDSLDLCELADIMNFDTMQLVLAQGMAVDIQAAVGNLQSLLDEPRRAREMGEAGRARVRERYRWSTVLACYERMWERLAAEAERYEGAVPVEENLFANDYLSAFGHYPTATLCEGHRCVLTEVGRQALTSGRLPSPYADIASLVDTGRMMALLRLLGRGGKRVGKLVGDPSLTAEGQSVHYGLLWAAKYGLVGLESFENQ